MLAAGLHGRPPHQAQWPQVVALASRAWLGPALYAALRRASRLDEIPGPIRDYLALLHNCNRERNQRLRIQLLEAVRALNDRRIQPILLKGAIHLFCADDESLGARIMSDLDIGVEPWEMAESRTTLQTLGYCDAPGIRGMGRPEDVGLIELRDRPSSRSMCYLSGRLRNSSSLVERDGAVARLPSATSRVLHLIVHDMIKEGDYWRCRLDLRHLHDLAQIAEADVDWDRICAAMAGGPARRALELQTYALHDLFNVPVPAGLRGRWTTKLRHVCRILAATVGPIGAPARLAGNLIWGIHRLATAHSYRWSGGRDFARRVSRTLLEPGKGSRL
jgi:hypothetical protein